MKGFPYDLRVRLSDDVPRDGQFTVMKRIPMYDGAETHTVNAAMPQAKPSLRFTVLNMEHGYRNKELIPFLKTCPDLKDTDVIFANELDDGTFRSGNIDSAKEIGEALGMNYTYGLEFIELVDSRDDKGYEGNAVMSRYPIVRADVLHMPEAYNWYFDSQKRIGARVAVFAELDVNGTHIGAVSIHLENRTTPAGRAVQIAAILQKAEAFFGDIPVVMGGDYNFNTFGYYVPETVDGFLADAARGIFRDPDQYEGSFALYRAAGYDYEHFNGKHICTRRTSLKGMDVALHIDWIFAKGMTCLSNGLVSTSTEDCKKWAPAGSPILAYDGKQLSDHNSVWAECKIASVQ